MRRKKAIFTLETREEKSREEAVMVHELGQLFRGTCDKYHLSTCKFLSLGYCPEVVGRALNVTWLSGKSALFIVCPQKSEYLGANTLYVSVCMYAHSHTHIPVCILLLEFLA